MVFQCRAGERAGSKTDGSWGAMGDDVDGIGTAAGLKQAGNLLQRTGTAFKDMGLEIRPQSGQQRGEVGNGRVDERDLHRLKCEVARHVSLCFSGARCRRTMKMMRRWKKFR